MGFRSVFITDHTAHIWPQWFIDKYKNSINFPDVDGPLSAKYEAKLYMTWNTLCVDIQTAIDWDHVSDTPFIVIFLHECGGITRVEIHKDKILWTESTAWKLTPVNGTHNYCYDCSAATNLEEPP